MARYLEVAADANKTARALMELIPQERQKDAAAMIAHLVNYGIRCAPRAVHSTVRLRAVERAVYGLPVRVDMIQKTDPKTSRTYNVLTVDGVGTGGPDEDGE